MKQVAAFVFCPCLQYPMCASLKKMHSRAGVIESWGECLFQVMLVFCSILSIALKAMLGTGDTIHPNVPVNKAFITPRDHSALI